MVQPLVSVIIPFFNREILLPRAIQSVIRQRYALWELILVDDASTDKSFFVADSYRRRFPDKIFVIRQNVNKGPGASANLGIENSHGEYIAFLDSDDEWYPNLLEVVMQAFAEAAEVDWVFYNHRRISDSTKEVVCLSAFDREITKEFRELRFRTVKNLKVIDDPELLSVAISKTICAGANSVIRRRLFSDLRFTESARIGQDRLLVMEAILKGKKFAFIDEILLDVYMHGKNISIVDDINNSLPKACQISSDLILVYEYMEKFKKYLNCHEKIALRKRLGNLYINRGRLMRYKGDGKLLEASIYYVRGLGKWPCNLSFWNGVVKKCFRLVTHLDFGR